MTSEPSQSIPLPSSHQRKQAPEVAAEHSTSASLQFLTKSEEWERVVHALTDNIMILDRSGNILWANKSICHRFRQVSTDLVGLDYRILLYGTTPLETPPPFESVLNGALSVEVETWFPTLQEWFFVSCHPLQNTEGRQWGAIVVAKEISDQKRTEEALRNIARGAPAIGSIAFFRSLVRTLSTALNLDYAVLASVSNDVSSEARTMAVWAHNRYADNFSWSLPNTIGARILSNRTCLFSNMAQKEFPQDPLLRQWKIVSCIGTPLVSSNGQVLGLLVAMGSESLCNVHLAESLVRLFADRAASELERNRAEEGLRDSEERYRAIVENAYDLIFETTTSGSCVYLSQNCSEILGCSPKALEGHDFFELVHYEERQQLAQEFKQKASALQPSNMVCRLQRATGEWRWFESHAKPFRAATGEIHVIIDVRDITESQRLEEERLRSSKLDSIGLLAGGIAHDFNNILTAVFANIGLAKMLTNKRRDPTDHTIVTRLAAAEKACLRARDLTKQLLTFAKGGAPIKNMTTVSHLITDTVEFTLRGSNVRCKFHLPETIWPVEIDEGQISQVLQNLIINADQAMPDGGIITVCAENQKIDSTCALPLKEGPFVVISVIDQGIGISTEHLTKIFDPYFSTKQKGSGLGLATTYSIMKRHEGHITVTSKLGQGTTCHLYLPAIQKSQQSFQQEEKELIRGTGRILVMDDEADIQNILGAMLGHLGYDVHFVKEGTEALSLYKQSLHNGQPYTAVIMDLTIPGGMGGKETVQHLLSMNPHAIVLVSSGYSNDPVLANPKQFGFQGMIVKPYNLLDLSNELHHVFH